MGCDIHLFVERRIGKTKYDEDIWEHVPSCPWYESAEHMRACNATAAERGDTPRYSEDDLAQATLPCFDPGRDYDLFGMLANVRNGRGFAGCDTGDGFEPVLGRDEPVRGFPDDASDYAKARAYDYGEDGHSHSWLTVAELLAYDVTRTTKHRGWVDPVEYIEFKETGRPGSWAGGISGGNVQHVSNAEMEQYIVENHDTVAALGRGARFTRFATHYTQVEWEQTYRDAAPHFFDTLLPELQKLGPPEDVRICFFFDN